ncbi:hypothetical protein DUT91_24455 [Phyllobacterium salinisoli]|uniref:Exo-alpha-sialidase n=1 Tax=Phyllobacterium salinisoli TaxID=1899321 RepID=A0A368JWR6_9HYPH|nr:hypothetical protein [Phyllobacterium salinisoli]RCS21391.1 hypothetical protein DUT91_24455 [Phyllobacterium salinisoli]
MSEYLYYTTAFAETGIDDDEWSTPSPVPKTKSHARPALAHFQGRVWCVHRGGGSDLGLYSNSFKYAAPGVAGGGWSGDTPIPNQKSADGPALAILNDQLWCVYRGGAPGHNNPQLYYTYYDGNNWSDAQDIPKQMSDSGPALAVFNDQLWCVYRGGSPDVSNQNPQLYYTVWDGQNWSDASEIPKQMSNKGPALAVFKDQLWCVYHGGAPDHDNPQLYYTIYDGQNWSNGQPITNALSDGEPALVYDSRVDELVCMWTGVGSDMKMYYSNRQEKSSSWPTARIVEGCYSLHGPGLTEFKFKYKNDSYDLIMCVFRQYG